jgi:beta-mannosidase
MTLKMDVDGKIFRNEHFFCAWKKCELLKSEINFKVKAVKEGFEITVSADRPAFYVSLFAEGICGEFDDNCYALLPEEKRTVIFRPRADVSTDAFKNALYVKHLHETYA